MYDVSPVSRTAGVFQQKAATIVESLTAKTAISPERSLFGEIRELKSKKAHTEEAYDTLFSA